MKLDFRECTLVKLDKLFGLRQVWPIQPMLAEWLESQADVSDVERQILESLKQSLIVHVHDWNESELGAIPFSRLGRFCNDLAQHRPNATGFRVKNHPN